MKINRLVLPLAKAEYLLNYTTGPSVGGDKRKFWHEVMGYESSEVLRKALLAQVTVDLLRAEGQNAFGERYDAILMLTDPSGMSWQIRTCWIVLFGEDVARFVTAFPVRIRRPV